MEIDANSLPIKSIPKTVSPEAYQAFSQSDYYLKKWEPLIKGQNSFGGFNPAAAIFGAAWCFHRKLYRLGIAFFVATFVLMQALLLASAYMTEGNSKVFLVLISSILLIHIPIGLLANKIYFNKAKKVITQAASSRIPEEYFEAALRDAGGTSFGAVLGFVGLVSVVQAVAGVIKASL